MMCLSSIVRIIRGNRKVSKESRCIRLTSSNSISHCISSNDINNRAISSKAILSRAINSRKVILSKSIILSSKATNSRKVIKILREYITRR